MRYLSKKGFADLLVLEECKIRSWIIKKPWTKGVHYVVIGKSTLVNVEVAIEWIKSHEIEEEKPEKFL